MLVTKVTQLENNKYNMVSALFPIQPGIPIDNKIRTIRTTRVHEAEGIDKIRNITSVAGVDVAENISLDEAFDYINNIRQEVGLIDQEPDWSFANEDNKKNKQTSDYVRLFVCIFKLVYTNYPIIRDIHHP